MSHAQRQTIHTITVTHADPTNPGPIDAHAFSAFLAGLAPGLDTAVKLTSNNGLVKYDFTVGANRGRVVCMDSRFILETIIDNNMTASPVMDSLEDVMAGVRSAWEATPCS